MSQASERKNYKGLDEFIVAFIDFVKYWLGFLFLHVQYIVILQPVFIIHVVLVNGKKREVCHWVFGWAEL